MMIRTVRKNFMKGEHATTVLGYYASEMLSEARKVWKEHKDGIIKVFEAGQKDIANLEKLLDEGVKVDELYDMTTAPGFINDVYLLGYFIEDYCNGEEWRQAPAGGEDFGFYIIECTMALFSGVELIEEYTEDDDEIRRHCIGLYGCL